MRRFPIPGSWHPDRRGVAHFARTRAVISVCNRYLLRVVEAGMTWPQCPRCLAYTRVWGKA